MPKQFIILNEGDNNFPKSVAINDRHV
jgi:hypothetical protein